MQMGSIYILQHNTLHKYEYKMLIYEVNTGNEIHKLSLIIQSADLQRHQGFNFTRQDI